MSEKLRVLLVVNTLPPRDLSGAGEQVAQLAWALADAGHDVEVLARGAGGARGPKVLFPLAAVWPALRRVRALRPHVVQVHESDGGLVLAALRLRRGRSSAPLLCALQQVSYREEGRAVRPLRDIASGRILARPVFREWVFRWLRAPFHVVLGRFTARRSDLVFAPSSRTCSELVRDYGAREVALVPNVTGAPIAGREPAPNPSARAGGGLPGGEELLYVGRLRVRKGVELLLEALSRLSAVAPGLTLAIVGDGERRASLERASRRLGLEDRVRFVGKQGPREVRELLARCRAIVVPSTYEGMPLVVLEAMEAARPIVASAVSGIPEVVADGETGWLVPPEDAAALAAALLAVWRDPQEAARRGRNGRARLEERYRPRHAAAAWLTEVRQRLDSLAAAAVAAGGAA